MAFTGTAFRLPMGIYNNSQKPVDLKYGPYHSIGTGAGQCFGQGSAIEIEGVRHLGLTIGITHPDGITPSFTEYWFKDGITNSDLVLKTQGGNSGGEQYLSGSFDYTFVPDSEGDGTYVTVSFPAIGTDPNVISVYATAISNNTQSVVNPRISNITTSSFDIGCSTDTKIFFRVEIQNASSQSGDTVFTPADVQDGLIDANDLLFTVT